jgi:flagellar motor protein MotB
MQPYEAQQSSPPIWAAFGDLMACLFGLFVLFFAWMVVLQSRLTDDLALERHEHAVDAARLQQLEQALAGPLESGLITLVDGRIGIRGSVLFDLGSDALRDEGHTLLNSLVVPLQSYVSSGGEALMVSGFTDNVPLRWDGDFTDNWELSAQRALTVTRVLIDAGIAPEALFAAGFGEQHPVAPNDGEENRAMNRRVEIAVVPRPVMQQLTPRPTAPPLPSEAIPL